MKPFYNDKIYNSIREVSNYATNLMSEYGIIIEDIKIGDRNDVLKRSSKIAEYYNEMMRIKEQAAKDIREYLISLKVK